VHWIQLALDYLLLRLILLYGGYQIRIREDRGSKVCSKLNY
jgi:hypothetical protein